MGGDKSDAENVGEFLSSGGPEDRRNDGSAYRGRRVGVPPVADAMEAAGIWMIKEYTQKWQANITDKLAFWPIYEV